MATGGVVQGATGNQDVDGLLSGSRWDSTSITYNFPTSASYYPANYNGANNEPASFVAVSSSFQSMVRDALHQYELVANLTFTEVGAGDTANISVARTGNLNGFSGYGYNPGSAARAGDAWFLTSTAQVSDSEVRGRGTWRLVMHELGHSLGLKHGQDAGGVANTPMTAAHDYNDYSIMSYRRTLGGSTSDNAPEAFSSPQTPMMYDIAALQTMYGANYGTQAGNTVYTWSASTGQAFIDGVAQIAPGANRIYGTLWDGGGIDTYDLSNYATDLRLDLRPGESSTFSNDQLAITDTRDGTRAGGNVFNALLFNGDAASLIENAVGGAGNDLITGNQADNMLMGGAGNDTLLGGAGNDTVFGNQGADVLVGNQGNDTLFGGQSQDTLFGGQNEDIVLGNLGDDVVLGNLGNDTLYGGQGNDTLYGGQNDDVLSGDLGNDVLSGDLGADRYVFGQNSGTDLVLGFSQAQGDRLDFAGQTYALGSAANGDALFTLSGGGTVELAGVTQAQVSAGFFA